MTDAVLRVGWIAMCLARSIVKAVPFRDGLSDLL